jgi:anti-sigma factor ChrR (cupin superfamily)
MAPVDSTEIAAVLNKRESTMTSPVRKLNLASPKPTIGSSTYVRPQDMEWKATQFEKTWIKVLYEDREKGEMTCMIKLEPGAKVPFHRHPELEQALVLEGSMYDHDGICRAGEYVWRKGNSSHENHTDEGAIIFAVYRKPNIYHRSAGFKITTAKKG